MIRPQRSTQGQWPITEADSVVRGGFRHFERKMQGLLAVGRLDIDVNRAVGVISLGLCQCDQERPDQPLGAQSAVRYHAAPHVQLVIDGGGGFGQESSADNHLSKVRYERAP